ncbi:SUN domain-containing protein 1-like [Thunnus albacares]|uniref:SUN domain-containing protein 1-like n=1 Tax=Thunnus albacares TaxID=8236 RepID=UPI001CF69998|nr:SUN domain-containing protein 1-like [Thunnus albacares]
MPRRSSRLISMGHYNSEGERTISYKETLYRVFPRRRFRRGIHLVGRKTIIFGDGISKNISNSNIISESNSSSRVRIIGYFFLMLFLCFGFACLIPTLGRTFLDSGRSESPYSPLIVDTDSYVDYEEISRHLTELENKLLKLQRKMNFLTLSADAWPNFALESQGASVVYHLSSKTYSIEKPHLTFFGIPIWRPPVSPKTVIQGHSHLVPGRCWAFAGGRGHLSIALSHPVTISHVSLGHISKSMSPTGSIFSAPKEFSVHGMETLDDEGTHLGTFLYDEDGDQLQTFKLLDHNGVYKFVRLEVQSNWGHPEYSCLYSFRVHGMVAD